MTDNEKRQLGYKPVLEYQDEYDSELDYSIEEKSKVIVIEPDEGKEEVKDLIEDLGELKNIVGALPGNVSDAVSDMFDPIIDFVDEELKDKAVESIPDEDNWEYIPLPEDPSIDEDGDKDLDINDMWGSDDLFPFDKEEFPLEDIYEKEYIKNLVDIFDYYSGELNTILGEFWRDYLTATTNKTVSEILLISNNILLNSSNIIDDAKHLLDSAVRQQIIKDMKINYFHMMFNAEETILRLKQLKATQELRVRYAKIHETDGSTKTNQMNNNILVASQMDYSNKYELAYENLYRYLNSSNKVLKDSLQTWIYEIKSKQTLIEREGIK